MTHGKIKFYDDHRGFGFINRDDGEPDTFFHINNVEFDALPQKGVSVNFDLRPNSRDGRLEAFNITLQ